VARRQRETRLPAPWLRSIRLGNTPLPRGRYPFDLPWLTDDFDLAFEQPVTILTGENGSGKSTLIEAIAAIAGFPVTGGGAWASPRQGDEAEDGAAALARHLRPSWLPKVGKGWFLRAASFTEIANRAVGDYMNVSHGEGFANMMLDRMSGPGLYLLDEPEAALSPRRQAELLAIFASIQSRADAQVILSTHSPMLMAVPGATLLRLTRHSIDEVALRDTDHFRLYQSFALDPEAFVAAAIAGDLDTLT